MEKEEFVRQAVERGYASVRAARAFSRRKKSFREEDLTVLFRKEHPDFVESLPKDEPEQETSYQTKENVNYNFVNVVERRYQYDPEPVYVRDEHMRLVLNPKRLKGV